MILIFKYLYFLNYSVWDENFGNSDFDEDYFLTLADNPEDIQEEAPACKFTLLLIFWLILIFEYLYFLII